MILRNLLAKIILPNTYNESAYLKFLRGKGVEIGANCRIWSPNQTHIDYSRPHMLHIGNYVKIARNVTILCHDYSRSVWAEMSGLNIGEAANTYIGDNVFLGVNVTILMGTHIGNNCIVGAGSVVSGNYGDGVVIAGNPGKVICKVDELQGKRESRQIESAKLYAKMWKKRFGKFPNITQMTNAFAWLYLPHTQETIEKYPKLFDLSGVDKNLYVDKFLATDPVFNNFDEFIDICESEMMEEL